MSKNIPPVYIYKPAAVLYPMVLSLPHSGSFLPVDFVKMSNLSEHQLHLSEDTFTDLLFWDKSFNIPMIKANYSRAYIDVNREPLELTEKMFKDKLPLFINHFSEKAAKGFGTIPEKIKPRMKIHKYKITYDEAKKRIENVYKPFHESLTALIKETENNFGRCIVLDGHSMPFRKWRKNYDIVIGNNFGTGSSFEHTEILQNLFKEQGFSVALNKPFSGGYTVCHYGCPELGVSAIQIEILRSLYMNEETLEKNQNFAEIQNKLHHIIKQFALSL